jgi:hypothetical protein
MLTFFYSDKFQQANACKGIDGGRGCDCAQLRAREQATALGVALVEGLARGMSLATGLAMGADGGHAP